MQPSHRAPACPFPLHTAAFSDKAKLSVLSPRGCIHRGQRGGRGTQNVHTEKGHPIIKNNIVLKERDGGRELMQANCYRKNANVLTHYKANQIASVQYTNAKQKLWFVPEIILHMQDILSIQRGKKAGNAERKKAWNTQHSIPSPSPHVNLTSIIQHKRDNRQTARGHLQSAGCQGRPVERAKACPHQSPAAMREPQRCSFPWGCNEIQRWRAVLELL